jgi:hypothetical protein
VSDRSVRIARFRDFALIAGGGASLTFALAFGAARVWFRNYFILTNRPDPLLFALAALTVAVVLGILHTFSGAPLPPRSVGAYKGETADR